MVSYGLSVWELNVIDEYGQELWYRSSTMTVLLGTGSGWLKTSALTHR